MKNLKISFTIIFIFLSVSFLFVPSKIYAVCGGGCMAPMCAAPICDTCGWCTAAGTPAPTGIHNPVVPIFGQGEGTVIIAQLIAQALGTAFIIGGLVLIAMILWSAFEWLTAGSEENKLKSARGRLTNALVGFIILIAFRLILALVADTFEIQWLKTFVIIWPTL